MQITQQSLKQQLDNLLFSRSSMFWPAVIVIAGALGLGLLAGIGGPVLVGTALAVLVGGGLTLALSILIIQKPYLGLVTVLASLPVQTQYPDIPAVTSILSLIGFLTIAGYLVQNRFKIRLTTGFRPPLKIGLLFLIYIFVTNPHAALFSEDRNWVWTYLQLLIMVWLAAELLPPETHKTLMIWYIFFSCLSSAIAIPTAKIGSSIYTSGRAAGLTANANEGSMYMVFALMFAIYLNKHKVWRWFNLIFPLVAILLVLGVVVTVSRTGFMVMAISLALWFILVPRSPTPPFRDLIKHAIISVLKMSWIPAILLVAILAIPSNYWSVLTQSVIDLMKGESTRNDTSIVRLELWNSAFHMWQDYPLFGVGVGQFQFENKYYISRAFALYGDRVAHNMYVTILAENGVVGFGIFIAWLASIALELWHTLRAARDKDIMSLTAVWLIVLAGFLFMGTTITIQYYKPLWITAGVSMALSNYVRRQNAQSKALAETSTELLTSQSLPVKG
ncbi:MAG: O-antigen ligase family protein [Chloroflexota bacterium]